MASGAGPVASVARILQRLALQLAEGKTDQRAGSNKPGIWNGKRRRRLRFARENFREACPPATCAGHAPSPIPDAAGGDEPFGERDARRRSPLLARACVPAARRQHARSDRHRCRARCGYRPAPARARGSRRNRSRSRISSAGRATALRERLLEFRGKRLGIVTFAPERRDHDVALIFRLQVRIDQAETIEPSDQQRVALFATRRGFADWRGW